MATAHQRIPARRNSGDFERTASGFTRSGEAPPANRGNPLRPSLRQSRQIPKFTPGSRTGPDYPIRGTTWRHKDAPDSKYLRHERHMAAQRDTGMPQSPLRHLVLKTGGNPPVFLLPRIRWWVASGRSVPIGLRRVVVRFGPSSRVFVFQTLYATCPDPLES